MQGKGISVAVVIIFFQWCLISYLLVNQHEEGTKSNEIKSTNIIPDGIDISASQALNQLEAGQDNSPISLTNLQLQQTNSDSNVEWEGVCVTLMLGTPKWFSRRYSVMINNLMSVIPNSWAIQLFVTGEGTSKEGLDINIGLRRLIESQQNNNGHSPKIIVTLIPKEKTMEYKKKRYLYHTDPWLWKSVIADKVLMFGGNGAFCANSLSVLNDFVDYDYLGIPWSDQGGRGGGGEFSIRNRNAMLEALQYQPYNGKDKDDVYFVKTLLQMNKNDKQERYKVASIEAIQRFAGTDAFVQNYETYKESKSWEKVGPPFVVQGTLPKLSHEVREAFLSLCPELKVIFPVLHSPYCFGASPNAEKCAETICALQEDHPGGC